MHEATLPGQPSWRQAISSLRHDAATRQALTDALCQDPAPAFFFEVCPVAAARADRTPFSFVVLPAPSLAGVAPDPDTFRPHFRPPAATTVAFPSLGRDAVLVAPTDRDLPVEAGAHLAAFLRHAPAPRVHELWQHVALTVELWWADRRGALWLSTSGLGVSWLHVRLDSRPKYYHHAPFKERP